MIEKICYAARCTDVPLTISVGNHDPKLTLLKDLPVNLKIETDEEFLSSLDHYERIRTCSPEIPVELYRKAAEKCKYIATAPPVSEGRVELLHYLKEQSITFEYHRYGSITETPAIN